MGRGPWRGTFGACGAELCAVRAVGVGSVLCRAEQSSAVVSTVVGPDVATKRAGLLGRREKCGTGWTAEAEAGAES